MELTASWSHLVISRNNGKALVGQNRSSLLKVVIAGDCGCVRGGGRGVLGLVMEAAAFTIILIQSLLGLAKIGFHFL